MYEIDGDFILRKRPESVVGTYANRFVHAPTTQMIIGPHIIDADRKVRTFAGLAESRLTATMTHLSDPARKVYFLGDGSWHPYAAWDVAGYHHHEFPPGFSAHGVRLVASKECSATAQFVYT